MKRTVEIVLTLIGTFVYMIGAFLGGLFLQLRSQEDQLKEMIQNDANITAEQANQMMTFFESGGMYLLVVSVVSILLGILAMFLFRGDKKPKPAGIILLIVGIVSTVITFGAGIFAGIFFVIAGIMALVRKPKQEITADQY